MVVDLLWSQIKEGNSPQHFFETCKILKIRKVRTSAYHAMSNGVVERFHRVLHDSIAHYIDSTGTNCEVVLPFLWLTEQHRIARRNSPFYLLHGREMILPNEGDLKPKYRRRCMTLTKFRDWKIWKPVYGKLTRKLGSITGKHTRRTNPIMIRKRRRGSLRFMIRFICFAP